MSHSDKCFMFQVYICLTLSSVAWAEVNISSDLYQTNINSFKLGNEFEKEFLIKFIHQKDNSYKVEFYEKETTKDYECQLYQNICFEKLFEDTKNENGSNITMHLSMNINTTSIAL